MSPKLKYMKEMHVTMAKHRKDKGRFSKANKAAIIGSAAVGMIFAGTQGASAQSGYNPDWEALADCESGARDGNGNVIPGTRNANAFNAGDPSWSYFQFMTPSWLDAGGGKYAARADGATWEQQKEIAGNLLRMQGPYAWFHCSTSLVPGWQNAGIGGLFGQTNPAPAPAPATATAQVVRPTHGTVTSGFGPRWGANHNGIDIANSVGTPVLAVANGEVISAGYADGFGQWVRVRHDSGNVTVYGHIETYSVSVGQRVTAGEQIATLGSRGVSTGPHLHFEVWLGGTRESGGVATDPEAWLAGNGVTLDWWNPPSLVIALAPAPTPGPAPAPAEAPVDTLTRGATSNGTLNGNVVEVEGNLASVYKIGEGDTLTAIAGSFGVTVDGIAELNPKITNVDLIYSDDTIKLLP